jgi:peptidoglycan/LPS O-acetylase OafA/YrhL
MQNKGLKRIVIIVVLLLLIPLIAMQFTTEVNWNLTDFIVAGILLSSVLLLIYYAKRKLQNSKYKVPIIIALFVMFLLIWAELAVGVFGTPLAGN